MNQWSSLDARPEWVACVLGDSTPIVLLYNVLRGL